MSSPISLFVSLTLMFISDRLERILDQFHQAIIVAIPIRSSDPHVETLLVDILHSLTMWESRPTVLTEMAYEWCSMLCEHYLDLEDIWGSRLLFISLEIGFRRCGPQSQLVEVKLTHTEHHQRMVDVVFKHGLGDEIADFLHAWIPRQYYGTPPHPSLHTCASHLVALQRIRPFSPRLRHILISSICLIGYQKFEQVGVEKTFELLDDLHIRAEDVGLGSGWQNFLMAAIRSPEAVHRLPYACWNSMVELISRQQWGMGRWPYKDYSHLMESLEGAGEWDRLECWIGNVWYLWGPIRATNLEPATLSLLRRRPDSVQKLERLMGGSDGWVLRLFQRLREQGNLNVAGKHTP